jgi:LuxR family transcriptional regulator, maltose regulon positive regulatory protein
MKGLDRDRGDPFAIGQAAMALAAWDEARSHFEAALAKGNAPEIHEALSWACWWQDDFKPLIAAREEAFRLYRAAGDDLGAGRMALWMAFDYSDFCGDAALSDGWLRRAERLLAPLDPAPEHGWLRLVEADTALTLAGDIATARRAATEAGTIGRRLGEIDCTMVALAIEGFARICEGEVESGFRRLDEAAAAATGGELHRLSAPVWILCYLIYSCERVRDFNRAAQWCHKMREVADRLAFLFPRGICQVHYAGVLILRGDWRQAEAELTEAEAAFRDRRPPWLAESIVRRAELCRRRGDLDRAEELFAEADGHPLALLGLAELALDRGRPRDALDLCDRFLRQQAENAELMRVDALELVVRAAAMLGEPARARAATAVIEAVSQRVATRPMQAAACFARALQALAEGAHERARICLEDAADLYTRSGAPYEAARARLELAGTHVALGRITRAREEAQRACAALERLGSQFHARRARALLKDMARRHPQDATVPRPALTPRQVEILRLIAQGCSDREIATALELSAHTVHRHVANALIRLEVGSRAAAVARAVGLGLV